MIDSGPHSPQVVPGRTDDKGFWTWQYVGTKVGTDHVQLLIILEGSKPAGKKSVKPKANTNYDFEELLAEASVTWTGGPDLTLGHLFPPALKIPSPRPAVTIDESTVNIGSIPATATTTVFYLSKERKVDDTSIVFGERSVPALAPGEEHQAETTLEIPALDPGIYWILACANAVDPIAELNSENNCRSLRVDVVSLVDIPTLLVCTGATASPALVWPPNHKMIPVTITGLPNQVSLQITSVRQDEPVNGLGDGDAAPDATLSPLRIRAERSGTGNGRVYHIAFAASAASGDSCGGEATVCVPHENGKAPTCVDDGANYDSTK